MRVEREPERRELVGDGERDPRHHPLVYAVAQSRAEVGGVLARAV
ncbi:MAG: hypothetical protein ACJLS2_08085 [Microcella pacifica]